MLRRKSLRGGIILHENRNQILGETKDFLVEYYKYQPEHILIEYPITLSDGNTEVADLVVTTKKGNPYMVIYVTTDHIPEDKIKIILTKSEIIYGFVRYGKIDEVPELWGIRKKSEIFRGDEFEHISDYPTSMLGENILEIILHLPFLPFE